MKKNIEEEEAKETLGDLPVLYMLGVKFYRCIVTNSDITARLSGAPNDSIGGKIKRKINIFT